MGSIKYHKGKYHDLMVQGSKNTKSKEKKIMKEKKPKSEIEDKGSKPIDENSMKKGKKKGSVTERNSYGLGYHKKQLNSRNQSFPILNRN